MKWTQGKSVERIDQDTDRDFFMGADEAATYGLVDHVLVTPGHMELIKSGIKPYSKELVDGGDIFKRNIFT